MSSLRAQRCRHHSDREAAARCPGCGGFFCRECVAEHGGRVLCAACLEAEAPRRAGGRRWRPGAWLAALAGPLALWAAAYLAGRLLLLIPSASHDLEPPAEASP